MVDWNVKREPWSPQPCFDKDARVPYFSVNPFLERKSELGTLMVILKETCSGIPKSFKDIEKICLHAKLVGDSYYPNGYYLLEITREGIFAWRTMTQQQPLPASDSEIADFVGQPHNGLEQAELDFMAYSANEAQGGNNGSP